MNPSGGIRCPNVYLFGEFTLDIREHRLSRVDGVISLRPRSFDTLAYLIARHGQLVTKDELLTALWADVVVTEGSLTHCIEEIRAAIGDDPRDPKYIQTVPRLGYRFIAVLRELPETTAAVEQVVEEYTAVNVRYRDNEAADASSQPVPLLARTRNSRRLIVLSFGAISLLVAAFAAVLFLTRPVHSGTINSIAVLPFDNISGNSEDEYLADGLTDALISDLASIGKLRVISRTSAMRYKSLHASVREIGRDLRVDAVVEGSVFCSGPQIRTTAALISTQDERRLWGEVFDRDKRDMLSLIRDITRTVAGEIRIELTAAEHARLMLSPTTDSPAYEWYLKGRYQWNKRTPEGFKKAIDCFERALEVDSQYAPAYVGLADCYNMLGDYDLLEPRLAFPRGRAASLRALSLDSSLSDAYASLAFAMTRFDWDWPGAENEYKRALALDASCSNAHHWYALFLATHGRFAEAEEEIHRALDLDPFSQIIATNQAWISYFERKYDEAIASCRDVLSRDSVFSSAHVKLGWVLEQQGRHAKAQEEFERAMEIVGQNPVLRAMVARSLALRGVRTKADKLIGSVVEESRERYVPAYHIAAAYAGLGESAAAMSWLRKSLAERSSWLIWLTVDPKFDGLRAEPGFRALLDSIRVR